MNRRRFSQVAKQLLETRGLIEMLVPGAEWLRGQVLNARYQLSLRVPPEGPQRLFDTSCAELLTRIPQIESAIARLEELLDIAQANPAKCVLADTFLQPEEQLEEHRKRIGVLRKLLAACKDDATRRLDIRRVRTDQEQDDSRPAGAEQT